MAVRTSLTASEAFTALKALASDAKVYLTGQRAAMVQATCNAAVPLAVIQQLGIYTARINLWQGAPGLAIYAQGQYNDPAYDVVNEFASMKTAISNAQTTLTTMFPKDGSGFILYQTIQADGSIVNRTFTSAQLANAVTTVDSVLATIA